MRKAWEALGVDDVRLRASTTTPPAGWPSPTPTSSTRCCGRSSTTRSSTAPASADRGPTVAVDAPARQVRLTIADGGPGIAEADRERLFTRFERGGDAAPDGGSGLGLYVSRELCRAMGGDLVLEPRPPDAARRSRSSLPGEPGEEG